MTEDERKKQQEGFSSSEREDITRSWDSSAGFSYAGKEYVPVDRSDYLIHAGTLFCAKIEEPTWVEMWSYPEKAVSIKKINGLYRVYHGLSSSKDFFTLKEAKTWVEEEL